MSCLGDDHAALVRDLLCPCRVREPLPAAPFAAADIICLVAVLRAGGGFRGRLGQAVGVELRKLHHVTFVHNFISRIVAVEILAVIVFVMPRDIDRSFRRRRDFGCHADTCGAGQGGAGVNLYRLPVLKINIIRRSVVGIAADHGIAADDKFTLINRYAAALVIGIAADLTAAHAECTVVHIYAAAKIERAVPADFAAVHLKSTYVTNTAPIVCFGIAANLTAIHVEGALIPNTTTRFPGDFPAVLAVIQIQGGGHGDGNQSGKLFVRCARYADGHSVQAKSRRTVRHNPCLGEGHILRQVIIPRICGQAVRLCPWGEAHVVMLVFHRQLCDRLIN